jgi:hypothetical protein
LRIELAMTFTGFPYTLICFWSIRGKGARATLAMFGLLVRANSGEWAAGSKKIHQGRNRKLFRAAFPA